MTNPLDDAPEIVTNTPERIVPEIVRDDHLELNIRAARYEHDERRNTWISILILAITAVIIVGVGNMMIPIIDQSIQNATVNTDMMGFTDIFLNPFIVLLSAATVIVWILARLLSRCE
ncbi:MAG: hypothetical protein WC525_10030 [Candidatus Thermoplasmatota archaeon]